MSQHPHEGDLFVEPESSSGGGALPSRLRLLCVGAEEPAWVGLTLQLDSEGCVEPSFKWVSTAAETLTLLNDESFDGIVIGGQSTVTESLALVRAIRAAGCDDPIVLIVSAANDTDWVETQRAGVELLITPRGWESRALVATIKRAMDRVQLVRDNHRLSTADRRRLLRERDEADYLLDQQRQIIHELEHLARLDNSIESPLDGSPSPWQVSSRPELPPQLDDYYQELLRTYVIMGSGNLGGEIAKLAELLAIAGFSPRQALELHLVRVEQLVNGLGNRSTRHVMARADLLALELMIHLGECYQRRFRMEVGREFEG